MKKLLTTILTATSLFSTTQAQPALVVGEKPVWVSTSELPIELTPLNATVKQKLIATLKASATQPYHFNYTLHGLKSDWFVYEGDLHIEKSLSNDINLIVFGNITIDGIYDDARSPYGGLITTGNLSAKHVLSESLLTVLGDVDVAGLMFDYYNDYVTEIKGNVRCKAYYNDDKSSVYHGTFEVAFARGYDGEVEGKNIPDVFVTEALDKEKPWENADEEADVNWYYSLNIQKVRKNLDEGISIFK